MEITGELYNRTTLPSGLNVVSLRMPYRRGVVLGLVCRVGSRKDPKDAKGMAHLIEHMLFKGTRNRDAFALSRAIERLGGNIDAYTTREETAIWSHIMSEHIESAIEIISDMFRFSLFDPNEIEKEKQVIIEEMNDVEDTPAQKISDIFPHIIWGTHPLAYPILGTMKGLKRIDRLSLLNFFSSHYTLSNSFFVAVGGVEHQELVDLVQKWLNASDVSATQTAKQKKPNLLNSGSFFIVDKKTVQANVIVGTEVFPYSDRRRYPFILLDTILGKGASSRLFQRLREEAGLVYTVYPFAEFFVDCGLYGIYIATETDLVAKAMRILHSELANLSKSLTQTELEEAKTLVRGRALLESEGILFQFNRVTENEILLNRYIPLEEELSAIEAVSLDEVRGLASEFLAPQNLTGVILGEKPYEWDSMLWGELKMFNYEDFED